MAYKMDASGNWTFEGSNSSGSKSSGFDSNSSNTKVEQSTLDSNNSLSDVANNKTETIKYAEEASFTIVGNPKARRGGFLVPQGGIAKRWKNEWEILETTHTVDIKGYNVDGRVGRIPYVEESKTKDKNSSGNGSENSNKNDNANKSANSSSSVGKTDNSGSKWTMDSSGNWSKTEKNKTTSAGSKKYNDFKANQTRNR